MREKFQCLAPYQISAEQKSKLDADVPSHGRVLYEQLCILAWVHCSLSEEDKSIQGMTSEQATTRKALFYVLLCALAFSKDLGRM